MSKTSSPRDAMQQRNRNIQAALWISGLVVALIVFIVLAKFVAGQPAAPTSDASSSVAPASLIAKITSLTGENFSGVGQGSASVLPKAIQAPALTSGSLPKVLYIGAEYCPYCATERWPMVVALSRFGSFSKLSVSHSSSTDVYPSTQTFSFHGATYTSKYLAFTGIETETNIASGTGYTSLDTPSSIDQNILKTYDATPYVPSASAGSIPFIDFGGKYLISGSTYDPTVLQGKTADQIATALKDKSSAISKGVLGASNTITAAICNLTNNQPSNVCQTDDITALSAKMNQ